VYVALWLEGFADLPDGVLEAAFKKTLATCKFWPVKIADVREHVERAEDSRAEDEWQNLLEYVHRHVNPDLAHASFGSCGLSRAPRLPPDIDHSARAAGGLYFLFGCSTEELQWSKKRFVEDLQLQRQSGDIAAFLPASPLAKLLEATAARFTLPAALDSPASLPAPVTIADTSQENQRTYTLPPEGDAEYAPMIRKQEEKFAPANERVFAEYRKAHGI
jgi:hypothetical protein